MLANRAPVCRPGPPPTGLRLGRNGPRRWARRRTALMRWASPRGLASSGCSSHRCSHRKYKCITTAGIASTRHSSRPLFATDRSSSRPPSRSTRAHTSARNTCSARNAHTRACASTLWAESTRAPPRASRRPARAASRCWAESSPPASRPLRRWPRTPRASSWARSSAAATRLTPVDGEALGRRSLHTHQLSKTDLS